MKNAHIHNGFTRFAGLGLLALTALPAAWAGPQFTVNSTLPGSQTNPDIVAVGASGFVAVWEGPDGDGNGIFARRFAVDGSPIGAEFAVNTVTAGNQTGPKIAADASGRFVISYTTITPEYNLSVQARRYAASGVPIDANPVTVPISFAFPSLAVAADGTTVFVGLGAIVPPNYDTVPLRLRRFNFAGSALGVEATVGTNYAFGRDTGVCFRADGSFAIAHSTLEDDGFSVDASLDRFSASASLLGRTGFGFNNVGEDGGTFNVACTTGGSFVASYTQSSEGEYPGENVFVQRFDTVGVALGPELKINGPTTNGGQNGFRSDLAADASGGFVIVWNVFNGICCDNENPQQYEFDVFAQRFNAAGASITPKTRLDSAPFTFARAEFPAIAIGSQKTFALWSANPGPGFVAEDIIGRVFSSPDFDTDTTPDAFSFAKTSGAEPGSINTSSPVTLSGFNAPSPISISGGSFSIGNAAFTTAPGSVNVGQTVTVRVVASASFNTDATATVTVGGVKGSYKVSTRTANTTPAPFSFTPVNNANLNTDYISNTVTISGIDVPVSATVQGGSISVNGGSFVTTPVSLSNGNTVRLKLHSANTLNTKAFATFSMGGTSRSFDVTTKK